MFFARWSAAAVEPVRSIVPDEAPCNRPPLDPVEAADCSCATPLPASGWLSGMAGTCYRGAHQFAHGSSGLSSTILTALSAPEGLRLRRAHQATAQHQ